MSVSSGFEVGHAKLGGRTVGTPNKSTAELKLLAREYGPEAVKKLAKLMRGRDAAMTKLATKLAETLAEPGTEPNKGTRELMERLLTRLEERKPENELGAARELLDRGYGKAAQPLTGEDGTGPAKILIERHIIDPRAGPVIEHEQTDEQPNSNRLVHVDEVSVGKAGTPEPEDS